MRRAAGRRPTSRSPAGKAAFFAAVLPGARPHRRTRSSGRPGSAGSWSGAASTRAAAREELRRALSGRTGGPSAVAEAATRRPAVPRAAVLLPAERWLLALVAQGAAGVEIALDELQEPDLEGLRSAPLLRVAQAVARRDERVTLPAVLDGARRGRRGG